VLIHPSAVSPYRFEEQQFEVKLTRLTSGEPQIVEDEPGSEQMERRLYTYYGWYQSSDAPYLGSLPGAMSSPSCRLHTLAQAKANRGPTARRSSQAETRILAASSK
jgi:hypothetical protein